MRLHYGRNDVEVLRFRKLADRLEVGKRLESVFGHKARELMGVFLDWFQRVPNGPVMHVAIARAARCILKVGRGGARPVRHR